MYEILHKKSLLMENNSGNRTWTTTNLKPNRGRTGKGNSQVFWDIEKPWENVTEAQMGSFQKEAILHNLSPEKNKNRQLYFKCFENFHKTRIIKNFLSLLTAVCRILLNANNWERSELSLNWGVIGDQRAEQSNVDYFKNEQILAMKGRLEGGINGVIKGQRRYFFFNMADLRLHFFLWQLCWNIMNIT